MLNMQNADVDAYSNANTDLKLTKHSKTGSRYRCH